MDVEFLWKLVIHIFWGVYYINLFGASKYYKIYYVYIFVILIFHEQKIYTKFKVLVIIFRFECYS